VGAFDGRVAAVRIADGTEAWSRRSAMPCIRPPAWPARCGARVPRGHLHGLDVATGEPRFETGDPRAVVSSPAAAGTLVIGAPRTGACISSIEAGRVLDRQVLAPGGIQSSPAAGRADVAIGSAEGVHLLRLEA
jgi:outer membrane protein assembly factor BamB